MSAGKLKAAATIATATIAAALALALPASAAAAPAIGLTVSHHPEDPSGILAGHETLYEIGVSNTGTEATSSPLTLSFHVPAGLEVVAATDQVAVEFEIPTWSCTLPDAQTAQCEGPEFEGTPLPIGEGSEACEEELEASCHLLISVKAEAGLPRGELTPTAEACGGGAGACTTAQIPTPVFAAFEFAIFDGESTDEAANPYNQAGGHPFALTTRIQFPRTLDNLGHEVPAGSLKNVVVNLPPGFLGNPTAAERCEEAQLATDTCPTDSQVGITSVSASDNSSSGDYPLYNMVPPPGEAAEFGFNIENIIWVHLYAGTRPDGSVEVTVQNVSQIVPVTGSDVTFWGVPAAAAHDPQRICHPGGGSGCSSGEEEKAFLSLPTSCTGPLRWSAEAASWQAPGAFGPSGKPDLTDPNWRQAAFLSHDNLGAPLGTEGCNALDYSSPATKPTISARPTTDAADAPSGLEVDVHTPQNTDPEGLAEAHLKDTTLTLPAGLVLNPSGANGLGACTPAQIGIDAATGAPDEEAPTCPEAAKIGTVEVQTPLLDHTAKGAVYVATPHQNPFGSLLAIYIVVNDPLSGTLLKLAGHVQADPQSGQLTTTVDNAPQLPFEHFKLHLKTGAGAPLRTPATCAPYTATATLTPWSAPDSGPPAALTDSWAISQGAGGGDCVSAEAQQPNSPFFDAGAVSPLARSYSPFVLHLRREDGSQRFAALSVSPPPGLLAKLTGAGRCPEAALAAAEHASGAQEEASPSCPADSKVGTVTAAAGAGPAPYYTEGTAYLAGPYKGAPLSLAIITPATAGPYDLGTIVVRTALRVDPETARIDAVSDPIPAILEGIPLDVRSVQVRLDKPQFTFNGTSCDPLAITGSLLSDLGQTAGLQKPFQLGECAALAFKPKLSLRLRGGTRRGANPALRAVLGMPEGGANPRSLSVALPHSEFLDQAHIGTVCTRVQFAAAPGNGAQCPAASVYGHVSVKAPLFAAAPFEGQAYLRSSDHKLPDLLLALHGPPELPIAVDLDGRIDSFHGGIRTTFESLPDVPFSEAVLTMAGGHKGLLQNSRNICAKANRATVAAEGQNGKASDSKPPLKARCKGGGKKKGKRAAHGHRGGGR